MAPERPPALERGCADTGTATPRRFDGTGSLPRDRFRSMPVPARMRCGWRLSALGIAALSVACAARQAPPHPTAAQPGVLAGMNHDDAFFPGAQYDGAVPTPDSVLGYRTGDKP